jgi:histone deacetylase complex regulatory component SIN3
LRYKTERLAAFRYLHAVKLRFDPPMPGIKIFNRRTQYNQFVYIMAEFKEQRIDVTEVLNRAKELFAGHTDLIQGLGRFLPNAGSQYFGSSSPPELHLHVAMRAIERQTRATSIKATALVHKIRALFSVQTDKAKQEVYKNYVAIFNEYIQGITSIQAGDVHPALAAPPRRVPGSARGARRVLPGIRSLCMRAACRRHQREKIKLNLFVFLSLIMLVCCC